MIFCYLLESAALSGGVRVVFDQARALTARGHHVIIRAKRGSHDWYHHAVHVDYVDDLAAPFDGAVHPDAVIATFWTTVRPALALGCPGTFHFCQGYEGDFIEYAPVRQQIEDVYRLPVAKLTVGEWLSERLRDIFGTSAFPVHTLGQLVDTRLFTPPLLPFGRWWRRLVHAPVKILLMGLFESSVKGIPAALHAIESLRRQGIEVCVTRVSSHALTDAENTITKIDAYFTNLPPEAIAKLYRTHDLLLAPSLEQEGFGLPFAEALASGLPCIASSIPSYLSFDSRRDYAVFVPPSDPEAMARAFADLLNNPLQQAFLRRRGPQVIRQSFSEAAVAERLEQLCSKSFNR